MKDRYYMVNTIFQAIKAMVIFIGDMGTCISSLKNLQEGYYVTIPAEPKQHDRENGYAVANISLENTKRVHEIYKLPSFISTHLSDNNEKESEYREIKNIHTPYNKRDNLYVKKEDTCEWKDESETRAFYAVIGNLFEYSIKASLFETIRKMLYDRLSQIVASEERSERNVSANDLLEFSISRVGIAAYLRKMTINYNIINKINQYGSK